MASTAAGAITKVNQRPNAAPVGEIYLMAYPAVIRPRLHAESTHLRDVMDV